MSDKELKVAIVLDKSGAKAEGQRFRQDQRKLNDQLLSDAEARERAELELIRRANREKIKAEADARDASLQASRAKAEADKQSAAAARKAAKEQVAAAKEAARAAKEAAQEQVAAHEKAASTISGLIKGAGSFAAQMVGLDSAKAVLGAIVDNFERARNSAYEASKMVNDYREALKELAALKGRLGQTTQATREDLEFRSQTLQTASDARDFQLAALGVGESAIGNQISPKEWKKALALGGKFQAVEGSSATSHGELLGLIPNLNDRKVTGEEAFRKEQQLYKIMQPGGFQFGSGIQQYAKLAPLIKSGVYKDTEAAALLSAFSTTNREGAGENVQQFTRATLGSIGRKGMPRVEGAEQQGKYLKSLGVDDAFLKSTEATRLPFAIGDKIAADLDRARAEAAKKGEEFNPYLHLKKHGFANQEDIGALMQYYGLKKSGALDQKFLPLAADSAMPSAKDALAPIDRAQATDPAMVARRAALAEESANVAVGAGPQEYLASIKRAAFARRRARGDESYGSYDELQGAGSLDPGNVLFGHRRQNDLEAQRLLWAEAERVGVPVPRRSIRMPWTSKSAADRAEGYHGDDELYELATKIRAAGGNALPGTEDVFGAAQRGLERSQKFEDAGRPGPAGPGQEKLVVAIERVEKAVRDGQQRPVQPPSPKPLVGAPAVPRR